MSYSVVMTRSVGQRTNDATIERQAEEVLNVGIRGNRGRNWRYSIKPQPPEQEGGMWKFTCKVNFKKTAGHASKANTQWKAICAALIKAGRAGSYKKYPWVFSGTPFDGIESPFENTEKSNTLIESISKNPIKDFGEINTDRANHFNHIYDRNHQIRIIHSAIEAAKLSNFVNRYHCVLYGPPGCGKSDILISTGKMLGIENEAFMKLDATSTTEAGAQRILLESAHIPPVLIVEEIEKTDEKSLRWLLGILDHRAEIRKTNFNIGQKARNVKMLCLATVNDIDLFKRVMSGALHSRFAHEVFCPRPDQDVMKLILEREVAKINGRTEWIEPTLDFCMGKMGWDDPRKIVPICLCGRDDLLDGSYQESLLATMPIEKRKGK